MKNRSLIDSIILRPLGPNQTRGIEAIESWDFRRESTKTLEDLRAIGESPSQEYIDEGIFALRQYHVVALLDPLNGHAVSPRLDPFWHSQILFTEQYTKFCKTIFGQYLHHYPLDHMDKIAVDQVKRQYDYTVDEVLPRMFNKVDTRFFPSGVPMQHMICNHAKDCLGAAHTFETVFPERRDLLLAA